MKYFKNKAGLKALSLLIPFAEGLMLTSRQTLSRATSSPSHTGSTRRQAGMPCTCTISCQDSFSFTPLSCEDPAVTPPPHRFLSSRIISPPPYTSCIKDSVNPGRSFLTCFSVFPGSQFVKVSPGGVHTYVWWDVLCGGVLALAKKAHCAQSLTYPFSVPAQSQTRSAFLLRGAVCVVCGCSYLLWRHYHPEVLISLLTFSPCS